MKILKRALFDTFSGQMVALGVLVIGGLLSLAYLFVIESPTVAAEEIPYVSGAIFGAFGALFLLFLWNLACAPYRIERDAYNETKKLIGVAASGVPLAEFIASRESFTLKEAACIKAASPITHGELSGPAAGYLRDLKKKVVTGKLTPFRVTDPILNATLKFRRENPRIKGYGSLSEHDDLRLGEVEVTKCDLIEIGFIGANWTPL